MSGTGLVEVIDGSWHEALLSGETEGVVATRTNWNDGPSRLQPVVT